MLEKNMVDEILQNMSGWLNWCISRPPKAKEGGWNSCEETSRRGREDFRR